MPTIKGIRKAAGQEGSIELGDEKLLRRYALEYLIIADNATQGPIEIWSTPGLPVVGVSTYAYAGESDLAAVCKRKVPKRDTKASRAWIVRVEFDNDPRSKSQETEADYPAATARPPIISWDSEYGEEILHRDYSEPPKPILNSAGLPFDPPITEQVVYPVLVIQRYQTTFTPATILAYENRANKEDFYTAPPGHALMSKIAATQVIEDAVKLWQVTYRIRFAVDGFDLEPLNQSSHYRDPGTSELVAFIKSNVPYIGNLKANGDKAAEGEESYGSFRRKKRVSFGPLALE
ncbi:hypothetical protein [Aureliella helgolandensis]|uniref:Uncharacterized protein n=1 Tax=Aureliella helgolandensis TaxID=2527968 RepID=A0A518GDX1_9BACT|nr:hypothetical protein [Aureliella helgolandensis]QDV26748.1 hypothetical protein Q31a_51270 [Aureliella helgolandensis]